MKSRAYLFFLFNAFCLLSAKGIDINGRVVELPDNIPSVGARCNLQIADSIYFSTLTDASGIISFSLDSIPAGLNLSIAKENFEPLTEPLSLHDATQFQEYFLNKVTTLKEFSVEANAISTANGNLLYSPPKAIVESSSYAIDMLGKLGIPGLIYNPVSRSVNTPSGSPVILIDGVPASQEDLKYLKPSRILNVEFSEVVPAKFASMGTSLISIRLKKRENGGDFNIQEMNDFTGTAIDAGTALNFHQGFSIWKLSSAFSYRHNDKTYDSQATHYMNENLPLTTLYSAHSPFNYKTNNTSLQYTYAPSADFLLSARYNLSLYNSLRKSFSDIEDSIEGEYNSDSRTHNNSLRNSLNIYLSKSINKSNSIDINVDLSSYSEEYESLSKYLFPASTSIYSNLLSSSRYAMLAMANYGHAFRDQSQLNVTYFLTLSKTKNDYHATGNKFRLNESNQQFYLEYRKSFFKRLWMYLKSGVSTNHIVDNGKPTTYWDNISRMELQWYINSCWNVGANIGYQSHNLSLGLLQDNLTQSSPYLYNTGTPDLKPSSAMGIGVTGNFYKSNYSFYGSALFRKTFSPILTPALYDKDLKAYLSRPENGRYTESYQSYIGGSIWNILNMFQVNGLLQFRHDKVMTKSGWKNSHNSIGGSMALSWHYKKWEIAFQKSFPMLSMNGFSLSTAESYDVLSVEFKPDTHWEFQLSYWYILSKKGWTAKSEVISPEYVYSNERQIHNNKNWIRLAIGYNVNFGSPFKGKTRSRTLNVSDSQSTYQDYVTK
ncbi:MAG: outer membrane beta-barrel family protein [Muribaculaceae bacterium]|nr:outer membrane beta-barrel family protein [Muribaculaceae bacterium]